MKKRFLIATFSVFFLVACGSKSEVKPSNAECASFIGEIEMYKLRTVPIMDVNREFPSTDFLIFTYQQHKDFSERLRNYLNGLKSTENEGNSRYILSCQKLLALSEDSNSSKNIKSEFEKNMTNNFSNALEIAYKRTSHKMVDVKSCNGYGNHVTQLISEYHQSTKKEHIDWIEKAILKYNNCKKNELEIKAKSLSKENNVSNIQVSKDANLSSDIVARCENYNAITKTEQNIKRYQILSEDCKNLKKE